MSLRDFEVLQKLGEGAFANVFKVRRKSDRDFYALKKVRLTSLSQKEKEYALNQVRIMASVSHPNIIGYKQAFIDQGTNTLCIIMELAQGGDLQQKIKEHKTRKTRFSQAEIFDIMIQILQGLFALHSANILHRDLKSANIFLSSTGEIKLGDLNISKVSDRGMAYTQAGTPYYASPEVWAQKPYNTSSDIWSLGCIVYELAALKPAFEAPSLQTIYQNVTKGIYQQIPSFYSRDLAYILRCMLQVNPVLRPSCQRILSMNAVSRYRRYPAAHTSPELLQTIKFSQDTRLLKAQLPGPKYQRKDVHQRSRSREIRHRERGLHSSSMDRLLSGKESRNVQPRPVKLPPTCKKQMVKIRLTEALQNRWGIGETVVEYRVIKGFLREESEEERKRLLKGCEFVLPRQPEPERPEFILRLQEKRKQREYQRMVGNIHKKEEAKSKLGVSIGVGTSMVSILILGMISGYFFARYFLEWSQTEALVFGLVVTIVSLYAEIGLYIIRMSKIK